MTYEVLWILIFDIMLYCTADNTGIKKNFFWVVSDLSTDFECFKATELKNELCFSLSR